MKKVEKLAIHGSKPVASKMILFGKPHIGEDEVKEMVDTLRSGWIGTGPKTKKFEHQFASYIGAPYAVSVSSCTAALHLSLIVSGIGHGDEVITTPLTFTATVNAIMHTGAKPVFVDVEPDTFNINPDLIEENITSCTKAILPVHFGGLPADLNRLKKIAKKHNLIIIEDAAHAVGAIYNGIKIGNTGNITDFSFYPNKNMTTAEGGMITLYDERLTKELEILRLHGMRNDAWKRYETKHLIHSEVVMPGYKYNMTDLQASLGIHQLRQIESFLEVREKYADIFDEELSEYRDLYFQHRPAAVERSKNRHGLHLYVVLLDIENLKASRDEFVNTMRMENIGVAVHYTALHLEPYYKETFKFKAGQYPISEWISERTISLPLSPGLTEVEIHLVVEGFKKVYNYYKKK